MKRGRVQAEHRRDEGVCRPTVCKNRSSSVSSKVVWYFLPIRALQNEAKLLSYFNAYGLLAKSFPVFPRRVLFGFEGDMLRRLIAVVAWASLAFIAYATLARVGFTYGVYFTFAPIFKYPAVRTFAFFEHVMAFAFLGAVLFLAYPRRLVFVCWVVFCSAVFLEVMQTLTPDRHGTLVDASQKIIGGAIGVLVSRYLFNLWQRRGRRKLA